MSEEPRGLAEAIEALGKATSTAARTISGAAPVRPIPDPVPRRRRIVLWFERRWHHAVIDLGVISSLGLLLSLALGIAADFLWDAPLSTKVLWLFAGCLAVTALITAIGRMRQQAEAARAQQQREREQWQ